MFSSFQSSNALATDCIPSVCRMFVYNDFTSMVTKYALFGRSSTWASLFIKSVVSLTYDWMDWTIGCRLKSTYLEICAEDASIEFITGLSGLFSFWTFGSR